VDSIDVLSPRNVLHLGKRRGIVDFLKPEGGYKMKMTTTSNTRRTGDSIKMGYRRISSSPLGRKGAVL